MNTTTKKKPLGLVKMAGGEVAVQDGFYEYQGRLVIGTEIRVTRGKRTCWYFHTTEAVGGLGIWFVVEEPGSKERLRRAAKQEIERADRLMHAFTDFEEVLV